LWSGAPAAGLSDQQTDVGRVRSDRRRDSILDAALEPGRRPGARPAAGPSAGVTRTADGARPISRSRLPLPPVPAGPRTTAAPFRAVPSPEIPAPAPAPDGFAPAAAPVGASLDGRRPGASAAALTPRSERSWLAADPAAPSAGQVLGSRASAPSPRQAPSAGGPSGAPSPAYGDWTKPSRSDLAEMAAADEAGFVAASLGSSRLHPAPATTMIPERSTTSRRDRSADEDSAAADSAPDDFADEDSAGHAVEPVAPVPATGAGSRGAGTGPATGSRAARRAELQAAEVARRETAKRNGVPIVEALADERPRRRPHRVTMGLVAMVVVALGVLGVYQVTSPGANEAGSQAKAETTTAAELPDAAALPTLPAAPVVEEPVAADVKAPVTVLNATQIGGLAAKVAASMAAAGWETPAVGPYAGTDVAASTVFFTEGDETQRQAAVQLVDQFPQLAGPAPRFFEVPADIAAPGLVVVTAGDWQP
jgi:hypothetical protein